MRAINHQNRRKNRRQDDLCSNRNIDVSEDELNEKSIVWPKEGESAEDFVRLIQERTVAKEKSIKEDSSKF